jgi:hypothetical protein
LRIEKRIGNFDVSAFGVSMNQSSCEALRRILFFFEDSGYKSVARGKCPPGQHWNDLKSGCVALSATIHRHKTTARILGKAAKAFTKPSDDTQARAMHKAAASAHGTAANHMLKSGFWDGAKKHLRASTLHRQRAK